MTSYENRLAGIESELKLVKWMIGFNLALSVAVVILLLRGFPAI